jgi:hypothetical protein
MLFGEERRGEKRRRGETRLRRDDLDAVHELRRKVRHDALEISP